MLGSYNQLKQMATQMREKISDLKILVFLCDPALRMYSHVKMQKRVTPKMFEEKWENQDEIEAMKSLAGYLNPSKNVFERQKFYLETMGDFITFGNYHTQLKPFLEIFPVENFLFLDGGGIISSPDKEFRKLEDFFETDHKLRFKFNETKGYPCLDQPVQMCLGSGKGHSRSKSEKSIEEIIPNEISAIRKFYRPEMEKLFKIIYSKTTLSNFCATGEDEKRFLWLEKILCYEFQENNEISNEKDITADYINDDNVEYLKTGQAQPPRGSTNKNDIGYFPPKAPMLNTACPFTPKSRFLKTLEQRYPNAIGIGFPKCGTSTMSFLDCHSSFVYRDGEAYFWNDKKRLDGLIR